MHKNATSSCLYSLLEMYLSLETKLCIQFIEKVLNLLRMRRAQPIVAVPIALFDTLTSWNLKPALFLVTRSQKRSPKKNRKNILALRSSEPEKFAKRAPKTNWIRRRGGRIFTGLQIERSGLEPLAGAKKKKKQLINGFQWIWWGGHCDGLVSRAGGMVSSCYRSRDTLWPDGPVCLDTDLRYFTSCFTIRESRDILQELEAAYSNAYMQACFTGQFVLPVHRHFYFRHYR